MTTDRADAPWNDSRKAPREIEVEITVTLSRTVTIDVDDHSMETDGFGEEHYDYSGCDLDRAVKEQVELPQNKFKDWSVVDMYIESGNEY